MHKLRELLLPEITGAFPCASDHSEDNSHRPEEACMVLMEKYEWSTEEMKTAFSDTGKQMAHSFER